MKEELIALRNLEFRYRKGEFRLRIAELDVLPGEKLALVGPSGSGKTTLLHLLAGILSPRSGVVSFSGLDLAGLAAEDRQDVRAARMGLVFQEFELLEYLDVFENVLLPYRASPVLELDATVRERAAALLEKLGLGDKQRRHPNELSQGERQRVAVCRALVTCPAILFGDEPTGNLDPDNRDQVMDALFRYSDETSAPLVVVTHDHDLVPRFERTLDIRSFAAEGVVDDG